MKFGNYDIELRNVKLVRGHDDSLPYTGFMYINDKKVAECYNDGWGGDSVITPIANLELFISARDIVNQTIWFDNFRHTMNSVADQLAYDAITAKEREKTIKKYQPKHIVLEKDGKLMKVNVIKSMTIPESLIEHPENIKALNRMRDKYIKDGYKVLNTNF